MYLSCGASHLRLSVCTGTDHSRHSNTRAYRGKIRRGVCHGRASPVHFSRSADPHAVRVTDFGFEQLDIRAQYRLSYGRTQAGSCVGSKSLRRMLTSSCFQSCKSTARTSREITTRPLPVVMPCGSLGCAGLAAAPTVTPLMARRTWCAGAETRCGALTPSMCGTLSQSNLSCGTE